jgi:hypothetical protein
MTPTDESIIREMKSIELESDNVKEESDNVKEESDNVKGESDSFIPLDFQIRSLVDPTIFRHFNFGAPSNNGDSSSSCESDSGKYNGDEGSRK